LKKIAYMTITIIVLCSIYSFLLSGCGSSGGGGIVGGTPTEGFELVLEAGETLLEGGDITPLSLSLRDSKGNFLQGQRITLSVSNPDYPDSIVGWVSPSWIITDSTYTNGSDVQAFFTSADTGRAIILAGYDDNSGNHLDSTELEILILTSLHFISLYVQPDTLNFNMYAYITCVLAKGTQDDAIRVGGKSIEFLSFDANNPGAPYGVYGISPSYPATSDSISGNGLNDTYTFSADLEGIAIIRAYYRNALGTLAATGQAIVTVDNSFVPPEL